MPDHKQTPRSLLAPSTPLTPPASMSPSTSLLQRTPLMPRTPIPMTPLLFVSPPSPLCPSPALNSSQFASPDSHTSTIISLPSPISPASSLYSSARRRGSLSLPYTKESMMGPPGERDAGWASRLSDGHAILAADVDRRVLLLLMVCFVGVWAFAKFWKEGGWK